MAVGKDQSLETLPFLAGGGEMGAAVRAFDWAATPLGPPTVWPQSLRSLVSLMLASPQPMFLAWGAKRTWLYNDAFTPILGRKHPGALGLPSHEVWAEAWTALEPLFDQVFSGRGVRMDDLALDLDRRGVLEEARFDFSYTPARDETGAVAGLFGMCTETTAQVMALRRLADERERFAELFDQAPTFMAMLRGPEHRFERVNPAYLRLVGHRPVVGKTVAEALPDAAAQGYVTLLDNVFATGEPFVANGFAYAMQAEPGGPVAQHHVDFVYQPIKDEAGQVTGIFVEGVDVSSRVRADTYRDALLQMSDRLRVLQDPDEMSFATAEILARTLHVGRAGYGEVDTAAETITIARDWNAPGVASLAGVLNFRDFGSYIEDLKRGETVVVADAYTDLRTAGTADALAGISAVSFVNMPVSEHGGLVALLYLNHGEARQWSPEDLAFIRDAAERTRQAVERRRAEQRLRELAASLERQVEARTEELRETEAALRQAQKMEAVGQLTGGIAHDFNNLLAGISGSLELLNIRLNQGRLDAVPRYIDAAQSAAKRAIALTQRLLAFSRRQTLDPKPTAVNRLIANMEELLRRSIGPDISMEVVGAAGLWPTLIDPNQLENALLNLCINARDAMPEGGKLTIETANKWLDDKAAKERDLPPGQYISVCVSDTGTGMTPEVVARAFDPFFTTKPLGQGTGLGLSMIYGFVRQSGGQVRIYSEVGQGTTMCLYLPRHLGDADSDEPVPAAAFSFDGSHEETVLVVDDEPTVRLLIVDVLQEAGYRVLEAEDGAEGLRVLQAPGRIDLLVTDVGLPGGMNGRQVADAGRVLRPELKVLFITGYAENAVVANGRLDPGMQIITKPFAIEALGNRIREMIDG